jgi:plasmid replication initiation protein
MKCFIGNQEKFQTNPSVHCKNTRNKHPLHRPVANLSCFQKGASYSGIRTFNNIPPSIISLKNEKTQFKVALKSFYMNTHFTPWMSFSHVRIICITDLYDCVNPYTV